jgi:hypothetical protein
MSIWLFSMMRSSAAPRRSNQKFVSPTDPAARWTAANGWPAVYAYTDNYLIDLKHAVIMDVEATTAVHQAEVTPAETMIDRTADRFDVSPSRLAADMGLSVGLTMMPKHSAITEPVRRIEVFYRRWAAGAMFIWVAALYFVAVALTLLLEDVQIPKPN